MVLTGDLLEDIQPGLDVNEQHVRLPVGLRICSGDLVHGNGLWR
jgi:hypothetical protein